MADAVEEKTAKEKTLNKSPLPHPFYMPKLNSGVAEFLGSQISHSWKKGISCKLHSWRIVTLIIAIRSSTELDAE